MNVTKIIKLFYLGYTVYMILVINTTSVTFLEILPSIIFMWINYFFYIAGFYVKTNIKKSSNNIASNQIKQSWLLNSSKFGLGIILLFTILSSIISVKYYTGQTPIGVIRSLTSNESLYYQYQFYFKEQGLAILSIMKIPYILMLFFVKFIFYYSFVSFLIIKDKISYFEKMYILFIGLSFAYIGIARGTNFEFFEIVMMIIFVILNRSKNIKKVQVKQVFWIGLIITSMIFVFYTVISARGVQFDNYISRDVYYDSEALIPQILPSLSFVVVILYGYFGFGFFYISKYISEVWFDSPSNIIAGIIPNGFMLLENSTIQEIMHDIVDMGVRWDPDMIGIINLIGYIGLLSLVFCLGAFSRLIINRNGKTGAVLLTNYIILIQMVSLPVGNFVFLSSASKLIVVCLSLYWFNKYITRIKFGARSRFSTKED